MVGHVQDPAIRFVHSTHGFRCETIHKDSRIHQYLDDWLVRARSHQACLQHTQALKNGSAPGLAGELREVRAKQDFDFVGYQFDLRSGRVQLTPDRWQNLQEKMLKLLSLLACPVREFMSLIGLRTATEKQVHLGLLHMRPIQWHLKNNWGGTRITRKGDPNPQVPAPPFTMVAE